MMTPRIRSEILVNAHIRRCQAAGAFATICRKGDADAGLIIVCVYAGDGSVRLLMEGRMVERRDAEHRRIWRELLPAGSADIDAQAAIEKQLKFDRDIWVVDVEDRDGQAHLVDPIYSLNDILLEAGA